MKRRSHAAEWVRNIMKTEHNANVVTPGQDTRNVESLLQQLYMMEDPAPGLGVNLFDDGNQYVVSITGFRQGRSMTLWYETFLDKDKRDESMRHITEWMYNPYENGVSDQFMVRKVQMDVVKPKPHPASYVAATRPPSARTLVPSYQYVPEGPPSAYVPARRYASEPVETANPPSVKQRQAPRYTPRMRVPNVHGDDDKDDQRDYYK